MKSKPIDREQILRAIRMAVKGAGGGKINFNEFVRASSIARREVFKHFPRWGDALRAAGFNCDAGNGPIDSALLLADWGTVAGRLRHPPTCNEYCVHGKYDSSTLSRRFGSWDKVSGAFRAFAADETKWKEVLECLASLPDAPLSRRGRSPRNGHKPGRRVANRPALGEPLDFGALRHTPVNETGVIVAFALLAERLGFMIEGLQGAFPDCQAKRRIGKGIWQNVAIEFEYESRNFRDHGHAPEGCDMIVCWEHNWAECPKDLEVIALREEIKRLTSCKTISPGFIQS